MNKAAFSQVFALQIWVRKLFFGPKYAITGRNSKIIPVHICLSCLRFNPEKHIIKTTYRTTWDFDPPPFFSSPAQTIPSLHYKKLFQILSLKVIGRNTGAVDIGKLKSDKNVIERLQQNYLSPIEIQELNPT